MCVFLIKVTGKDPPATRVNIEDALAAQAQQAAAAPWRTSLAPPADPALLARYSGEPRASSTRSRVADADARASSGPVDEENGSALAMRRVGGLSTEPHPG